MACPSGFSASPTGACLKVTTERAAHWDCAALCGASASLACISSAEDNEFISSLAPLESGDVSYLDHQLWLGGYKASDGGGYRATELQVHGYKCSAGQQLNYSKWANFEPSDQPGFLNGLSKDCVKLHVHDTGAIGAGGNSGTEADWAIGNGSWSVGSCADAKRCVCEYGAGPTEEYAATINADTQLAPMVTALWVTFGVVLPLIWLLPPLVLLVVIGICALVRRRAAPASAAESAAVAKLEAAERAARSLRWRVNGFLFQLGYMLYFLGLIGSTQDLTAVLGSPAYFQTPGNIGLFILILAIRPVDVVLIRVACIFFFVLYISAGFGALAYPVAEAFSGRLTSWNILIAAVIGTIGFLAIVVTLPTLWPAFVCDCCDGCPQRSRVPPRRLLRRLWIMLRFGLFMETVSIYPLLITDIIAKGGVVAWRGDDNNTANLMHATVCLLAGLVLTPANRGRVLRLLNRLLARGGSEKHEEAAAVAALLGSRSAAATLAESAKHFRAMKLNALTRAHLADNKPDPELIKLTVPAKLGECHAFVSHSWSDDGEAKYDRLHEWAKGDVDVEAEAWAKGDVLLWLDKACIDQLRIEQSLACLPCFLAGCRQLLCLAGPSYPTRLWGVMEIFVFMKMGGERGSLRVKLLDETAGLAARLASFDAGKAQTFLDRDRQRLWATIEATFGTFDNFNRLVRVLIARGLETDTATALGAAELMA